MIRSALFRTFSAVFSRLYGTRLARAIWRIPGSRGFYGFLVTRLRPDEVTVRGSLLRLDPLDSLLLSVNGTYEEAELDLFRDCLRAGDVVLDVGAHLGLYTLEASRGVSATGRVIAFEPSTTNFDLLEHNVRANLCTNVVTVRAAVADTDGEVSLRLSDTNSGDHQISTELPPGSRGERIRSVSIDSYCEGEAIAKVDVVKMDIQGGEPAALAGARRTFEASDDLILFTEVSPGHLAPNGGVSGFVDALEAAGFDLWALQGGRVVPRTAADLRRLHIDAASDHADLICVKGAGGRVRLEEALGRRS